MTPVGDCTAQHSAVAMNRAVHNHIPCFAHVSSVYIVIRGNLSWVQEILAGIIVLVLHISIQH